MATQATVAPTVGARMRLRDFNGYVKTISGIKRVTLKRYELSVKCNDGNQIGLPRRGKYRVQTHD